MFISPLLRDHLTTLGGGPFREVALHNGRRWGQWLQTVVWFCLMMTSSNGNIFGVTDPLCGEFTGHRWIPLTKASDAELWCFLWSAPYAWVNNSEVGDLRRHRAHYDVIVMPIWQFLTQYSRFWHKRNQCDLSYPTLSSYIILSDLVYYLVDSLINNLLVDNVRIQCTFHEPTQDVEFGMMECWLNNILLNCILYNTKTIKAPVAAKVTNHGSG